MEYVVNVGKKTSLRRKTMIDCAWMKNPKAIEDPCVDCAMVDDCPLRKLEDSFLSELGDEYYDGSVSSIDDGVLVTVHTIKTPMRDVGRLI
jgi:hypothetical protein